MHARSHELAGARGALIAAAPAPLALLSWWRHETVPEAGLDAILPASAAVLAFALAAHWLPTRPRLAQLLLGLGLLGTLGVALPALVESPAMALLLGCAFAFSAVALHRAIWPPPGAPRRRRATRGMADAPRAAALAALGLWLFTTLSGALQDDDLHGLAAITASIVIAIALTVHWCASSLAGDTAIRGRARAIFGALLLLALAIGLTWGDWARITTFAALFLIVALFLLPRTNNAVEAYWWDPILGHPERLFAATFLFLCVIGTLLLAMPQSSASGLGIGLEDAAFTAVSAVCVTGLTVVDTPTAFSPLGQVLLLLLIQAGGLGIMTFSTAAMRLLGRRMSLRHEGVVARIVSPQDRSQVFASTARIVTFTLAVEGIGALALWPLFVDQGMELGPALWKAVFTAISAFCNAGFALNSDSLVAFQSAPLILHIVATLIILGGLAPAVVLGLPALLRRPRAAPPVVRLVVLVSALLLAVGFVSFLILEWSHSLAGLSPGDKLTNAWFQSVTLRTAGFNSVDFGALQPATLLFMMVLMFIGGSPGGTAGGIKTTTVALLFIAVATAIRGRGQALALGRAVDPRSIYKAAAVTVAALATLFIGLVLILLTQDMSPRLAAFEVVSAVGTVGLSIGGTAELDAVGKAVIMVCMFLGRVGSLTLLMFLSQRGGDRAEWKRPELEIEVA